MQKWRVSGGWGKAVAGATSDQHNVGTATNNLEMIVTTLHCGAHDEPHDEPHDDDDDDDDNRRFMSFYPKTQCSHF